MDYIKMKESESWQKNIPILKGKKYNHLHPEEKKNGTKKSGDNQNSQREKNC